MTAPMHRRAIRLLRLTALLCPALLGAAAHAGMMSPCQDPIVLPSSKVHVFLLPYQAEGPLTERGRELATIVQRHVLYAALKYPSIAVEELTGESRWCGFDVVAARVLPRLRAGQTAIFVWGRLFEQEGKLRLRSTALYTIAHQSDTVAWNLDGLSTKATATVPPDPVLFAPREIPFGILAGLQAAQQEARRLHREPNTASPYEDLPGGPDAKFAFEVLGAENDWMHVRLFRSGQQGWLSAHALTAGDDLKGTFPELYFVDGLIGYNEIGGDETRYTPAQVRVIRNSVVESLNRYLDLSSSRGESDARALAAVLVGTAQLRAAGHASPSIELLETADQSYQKAERNAPTSTVANTFHLACALALCWQGRCEGGANQLHSQFLAAVAADPTNAELLGNLDVLYSAASDTQGRMQLTMSAGEIDAQRSIVAQAKRALSAGNAAP
jgi:hypothetical protein